MKDWEAPPEVYAALGTAIPVDGHYIIRAKKHEGYIYGILNKDELLTCDKVCKILDQTLGNTDELAGVLANLQRRYPDLSRDAIWLRYAKKKLGEAVGHVNIAEPKSRAKIGKSLFLGIYFVAPNFEVEPTQYFEAGGFSFGQECPFLDYAAKWSVAMKALNIDRHQQ